MRTWAWTKRALYLAFAFASFCFMPLSLSPSSDDAFFSFKISEAQNAALLGCWGPRFPSPLIPVGAALLPHSGRVLLFAADRGDVFGGAGSNWHTTLTAIYDSVVDTVTATKTADTEHCMFCPGVSLDIEGRPIVSGGMSDKKVSAFHETGGTWSALQNMTAGRGYHAQVTLSSGNIFTIGGSWSGGIDGEDVPSKGEEVFDFVHQTWKALPGCLVEPMLANDCRGAFCSYNQAWLFAWKNGSVFQAGPSSAMNRLNKLSESYSTRGALIITLSDAYKPVKVEEIRSVHYPRVYANSVVLPKGHVFVNGGVSYAKQSADVNASLIPETWNPITREFVKAAESPTPRNYHSTAILLPDATVLTGGGGLCWRNCGDSSVNHLDVQVYYPPYLLDSQG
ncbi:hypothetical protein BJ170DRAFT_712674 [Xylariales sp. AK1849]|nr:hypothetical protein BJ170DRAFT_712674 [Xylariales sp. AK1849]